jgi:hypothetical protein
VVGAAVPAAMDDRIAPRTPLCQARTMFTARCRPQ